MEIKTESLPKDIDALHAIIIELLETQQALKSKNEQLEYRLLKALQRQYTRKSEKLNDGQLELPFFDEPNDENKEEVAQIDEEITIASYARKKSGRNPLPKELPREQIIYDLTPEQKICSCGYSLHQIGEEKSEQLEFIPAHIKVFEHVRLKYACRSCEECVKTAESPKQPIPKSLSTPGLLSHVIISKLEDHLPLYRQEKMWQRIGVDLPRATLSNWVLKCGELVAPLVSLLKKNMINGNYIHADETPVQVLQEDGRAASSKSYMWVYASGPPNKPLVIYEYHPTRKGQVAYDFLSDFKGYLQTDAYPGYNSLRERTEVSVLGCWAHARRKFFEVVKATKDTGKAQTALNFISKLYEIEKKAGIINATADDIFRVRQEKSKAILERFKTWLEDLYPRVPPKSPLGAALYYTISHWESLNLYLTNGYLRLDNNYVENKIRPFALGRRNWLFMGNARGATAAANLLSLIESAKANGLGAYYYLRHILTRIPNSDTEDQLKLLLPHLCDPLAVAKI
jgi:transposase